MEPEIINQHKYDWKRLGFLFLIEAFQGHSDKLHVNKVEVLTDRL